LNSKKYVHSELLNDGAIQEIEGLYVQVSPSLYDEDLGFCPDKSIIPPDELII
jgi:hypothetical protein